MQVRAKLKDGPRTMEVTELFSLQYRAHLSLALQAGRQGPNQREGRREGKFLKLGREGRKRP
jgi:hypothetical protein